MIGPNTTYNNRITQVVIPPSEKEPVKQTFFFPEDFKQNNVDSGFSPVSQKKFDKLATKMQPIRITNIYKSLQSNEDAYFSQFQGLFRNFTDADEAFALFFWNHWDTSLSIEMIQLAKFYLTQNCDVKKALCEGIQKIDFDDFKGDFRAFYLFVVKLLRYAGLDEGMKSELEDRHLLAEDLLLAVEKRVLENYIGAVKNLKKGICSKEHDKILEILEFVDSNDVDSTNAANELLLFVSKSTNLGKILKRESPKSLYSLLLDYVRNHPKGSNRPDLDAFIKGMKKNRESALHLIKFFQEYHIPMQSYFKDWVEQPLDSVNENCLADIVLKLSPDLREERGQVLKDMHEVLQTASMPFPEAQMAAMLLTKERTGYLKTILKWIEAQYEELALQTLKAYNDFNMPRKIARIALMQEKFDDSQKMITSLLLSGNKQLKLMYFSPRKLSSKRCQDKFKRIFDAVCAESPGVVTWLRLKALPLPSDLGAEQIFAQMSQLGKESFLRLCFHAETNEIRTWIFDLLARQPNNSLMELISERKVNINELFRSLVDKNDYSEVATSLHSLICRPKKASTKIGQGNYVSVIDQIKATEPQLSSLIDALSKDPSSEARQFLMAMADWTRYADFKGLTSVLEHYSLAENPDLSAENFKKALVALECGRFGMIEEVVKSLQLDPESIMAKAINACNAFAEPPLLRMLLLANPKDVEELKILENLVKDPEDAYFRYCLQLKIDGNLEVYQDFTELTPKRKPVVQNFLQRGFSALAEKVAANQAFKVVYQKIVEAEIDVQVDRIREKWLSAQELIRTARKDACVSLKAYEMLRTETQYAEEYQELVFTLSLAQSLIIKDGLNVNLINRALNEHIVDELKDTDFIIHLRKVLTILRDNHNIQHQILLFPQNQKLSQAGRAIVNGLQGRDENSSVSDEEVRLALLSAILSRPRQGVDVQSCFVSGVVIKDTTSAEGIAKLISDYKQILLRGKLVFVNMEVEQERDVEVPVNTNFLSLDKGLVIVHPLIKAFEYTLAQVGRPELPFMEIVETVFRDDAFVPAICQNVLKKMRGDFEFDVDLLQKRLIEKFKDITLEMFNPEIIGEGSPISVWQLTLKKGLSAVTSAQKYQELYVRVVIKVLGEYRKEAEGNLMLGAFLRGIEDEIVPLLDPKNEKSKDFITGLLGKFPQKQESWLWCAAVGGHTRVVLAKNLGQSVKSVAFKPLSYKNLARRLLEHCDELPQQTKEAAMNSGDLYLPLEYPDHALNFLPSRLLPLLKDWGTPQKALEFMEKECSRASSLRLDSEGYKRLISEIISRLELEEQEVVALQTNLENAVNTGDDLNFDKFASLVIRELYAVYGVAELVTQEIIDVVDSVLWQAAIPQGKGVFYPFADTNWATDGHNNCRLHFGWSFVSRSLTGYYGGGALADIEPARLKLDNYWDLYSPTWISNR